MKKKFYQVMAALMIFILTAAIYTGCAGSVSEEEKIVVPKEQGSGGAGGETDEGNTVSSLEGISGQVQAPEQYETEFSEGQVHVSADAPVILPDGAGFKLYRVTGRVFTQEDYDKVNQVLLKGGVLWDKDYEAGEASKDAAIVNVPAVVCYTEEPENWEENILSGFVTTDQKDYLVVLNNNLSEDWKWVQFEVRGNWANGTFVPSGKDEAAGDIPVDKIREEAEALIAQMGFDGFSIAGEEYVHIDSFDELTEEKKILQTGYGLHFTRMLDGIPVTYTHKMGTTVEDDGPVWPYETVDVVYCEEGLQNFMWVNPYQIEAAGEEYVFLLPFSDIQAVFEKMIPKKASSWIQSGNMEVFYQVDEVRLGYMRVRDKENAVEGMMIPVWDFFGSETINFHGGDTDSVTSGTYESLLTVNAMDGTVIDRGLGY